VTVSMLRPRVLGAALLGAGLLAGCATQHSRAPAYASILHGPEEPRDVAEMIRRPRGHCLEQAHYFVREPSDLLDDPLPDDVADGYRDVVRNLHPIAKQVLRRTAGVWFAHDVPGAAARFIPCTDPGRGRGLILVDVTAYPLGDPTRDVDVPNLYWRLLGPGDGSHVDSTSRRLSTDEGRAVRYVLLHELGHALSLLAGEFDLTRERQFEPRAFDGFLSFSWRAHEVTPSATPDRVSFVPMGLAFHDWRQIRDALNAEPTWLAPGYRRPIHSNPAPDACAMVQKLPAAGFVTPAAALSPTEDYAELFAHAILADEKKLSSWDRVVVDYPGCFKQSIPTPYFSPGVGAKRSYIEQALELAEIP
jgi:hypothetical protein